MCGKAGNHAYIEYVRDANNLEDIGAGGVVIAAQVEESLEDGRRNGAGELRVLRRHHGGSMAAHRAHHAIGNLWMAWMPVLVAHVARRTSW